MPKNIVICCDGTGDEFNPQSNSNVVKLCSTLVINQDQASYYHPGVGTMGAPTADSWWEKQGRASRAWPSVAAFSRMLAAHIST